jgi:hypothetical protein
MLKQLARFLVISHTVLSAHSGFCSSSGQASFTIPGGDVDCSLTKNSLALKSSERSIKLYMIDRSLACDLGNLSKLLGEHQFISQVLNPIIWISRRGGDLDFAAGVRSPSGTPRSNSDFFPELKGEETQTLTCIRHIENRKKVFAVFEASADYFNSILGMMKTIPEERTFLQNSICESALEFVESLRRRIAHSASFALAYAGEDKASVPCLWVFPQSAVHSEKTAQLRPMN